MTSSLKLSRTQQIRASVWVSNRVQCDTTLSRPPTAQEAGIDVRLGELAGLIQETIESYEVEVDGKTIPGTNPKPGTADDQPLIIDSIASQ